MSYFYAIDPGVRHCGVAHFKSGTLIWAKLIKGVSDPCPLCWVGMADSVLRECSDGTRVVEFPRAYVGAKAGGDYDDLLNLAAVIGALRPTRIVRPDEWKGQMKKDLCNKRVVERLEGCERERIVGAGALTHNVLDAVGVGLYCLGRFDRRRVFSEDWNSKGV